LTYHLIELADGHGNGDHRFLVDQQKEGLVGVEVKAA
jgi:hypothetical protein